VRGSSVLSFIDIQRQYKCRMYIASPSGHTAAFYVDAGPTSSLV